ncbi:hypothetical protein BDV59DRAFT_169853 [Aspergillus ambiguus]|uniref:uncharacterized protein n=1 Tax=Aspergillus ambiguus TaxID=176160 RepID=UPI003CCD4DBB
MASESPLRPANPPPPFPLGWIQKWDSHFQRAHFVHRDSKILQWEHPSMFSRGQKLNHDRKEEHKMDNSWIPSDSDIDEVDRIM